MISFHFFKFVFPDNNCSAICCLGTHYKELVFIALESRDTTPKVYNLISLNVFNLGLYVLNTLEISNHTTFKQMKDKELHREGRQTLMILLIKPQITGVRHLILSRILRGTQLLERSNFTLEIWEMIQTVGTSLLLKALLNLLDGEM
ncbi:uncharacterized protein M6B38_211215 [Iris pallida]|uniref:Uncharacterized protein n=1 Tax=Iris pallida TaxID=29817 RepID=A0AAX6E474_IRIPA|nr:uncharacterized protein M6B38_211215 [Iris pallida]